MIHGLINTKLLSLLSMEQSYSSEFNYSSASQGIPRIFQNIHWLVPTLSQINLLHALPSYFFKSFFNIILSLHLLSGSFPSRFPIKPMYNFQVRHARFIVQNFNYKPYTVKHNSISDFINPLKPELNSICYLLALLGAHHFLHVSRIRVKLLTFRLLMSYIYIWSTHSWCF